MNTKTKAILASTLLTALFAGQTAIAGQDNDDGVFATDTATTESELRVNYIAPKVDTEDTRASTFDNEDNVISGRK